MAVIHWVGGSSTQFNNPANWSPPQVPGAADDVVIDLAGGVVINSPVTTTINSLSLIATATLTVAGGTSFNVTDGTNGSGIAGTLVIPNNAELEIGGTIVNSGTILESSTGTATQIRLTQTHTTLTGGGKVVLSPNTNNQIYGALGTFELENVDNTIIGAGNIGNGQMVLTNAGVINANDPTAALTINTAGNVIRNTGTMEATLGGDLNILSPVNNVGGTIEATGVGSIVFLAANVTGGSVFASAGGVVQTSGASGVLDGLGLHPVTNGSALQVQNGQALTLLGTIINNSSINLNASGNNTDLRIGSPIVSLQGTGAVHLTNHPNNRIFGNAAAYQLINQSNVIDGAGQLGSAQLTFINRALVDANQPGALVLDTSGNDVVNTGTLQSSGSGGLAIQNTAVNNAGGTVQAMVAASHVDLAGGTIRGGTLHSANGGVIQVVAGNAGIDGLNYGAVTNKGTILVNDQRILSVAGTINNTGTIRLDQQSSSGQTDLRIASQAVTLTGSGRLSLSNNTLNRVFGNSGNYRLVNVNNVISGAGQLGAGQLTLVNQTKGTISADQAAGLLVTGQMVLNTQNSVMTNAGLVQSINTGGLLIQNTVINNAGGTIRAHGANSFVDLGGATIQGGTLITAKGGTIETVGGNGALDGITNGVINNRGILLVNSQTQLDLSGVINNTSSILVDQEGNSGSTRLRLISQDVTLQGAGKVTLSANTLNQVYGAHGNNRLTNVDNTIAGGGQIGVGASLYLMNGAKGIISANTAAALTINTGGNLVTNAGTMQATGTGGLVISSTAVNNAGGTIQSVGANTHVDLVSATIQGGTLRTASGGRIQTLDRGSVLDGLTAGALTNLGSIHIVDNTSLSLVGTINNVGTIGESSAGSNTQLRVASQNVVLQGGGKVLLSNNVNNLIFGNHQSNRLTNVDNAIIGSGQIGTGQSMFLVNKGVITANQKASLTINTGPHVVTNTGIMQSTGTTALNGGLDVVSTAINNAGGTIRAIGALAHVDLDGATIQGGLLTTSGGALITTVGSGGALDGLTSGVLTNTGTVLVNDHTTLTLIGTINNTGMIRENATSGSGATDIRLGGQFVTLTGAGQFLMTDNPTNRVFGNAATHTLINQGNTISGAGQFGAGGMEFINNVGTIQGTGSNALVVNLGSGNGINNATINGKGSGGVLFASGNFTNNGSISALDGSFLTYQGGAINTNLAAGDLVGGTWRAVATGHGATLTLSGSAAGGGPVVTNAATIQLSGDGASILSFDPFTNSLRSLEQTLTTVAAGGSLQVLANRTYTTSLNLSNSGIIQLGGGAFQANNLTVTAGARIIGSGSILNAPVNSGKIQASGGLLKVTGQITGTGSLQIDNGSTLQLGGATSQTALFSNNADGVLKLDVASSFTGTMAGVTLGDIVNLADIPVATIKSVSFKSGPLVIQRTAGPDLVYTVTGTGIDPAKNHFAATSDGGTGTLLTLVAGADPGGSALAAPASTVVAPLSGGLDPAWIGGSGNSFNTAANWNPALVPTAGMDAVINLAAASVVSSVNNTMATLAMAKTATLSVTGGTFAVTDGTGVGGLKGKIAIGNGAALSLGGTIANSGTITASSTGSATKIVFTQTTNELTSGGRIILSPDSHNQVFATSAAHVLRNVNNKITGSGELGNGQLTLVNEALGVIDANQSAAALNVNTGGNTITNRGTMQATLGGDLNIVSTVNNTGGTIIANGAGSVVFLASTVLGGTVSASAGGVVQTTGGSGVLDGLGVHPVTNTSAIQVGNGQTLTLLGVVTNDGAINLNATGNNTDLRIASPIVTLKGTGLIHLSNNPNNRVFGNAAAFQLNNLSNTIDGAGQLGAGQLTFSNAGLVDANQNTALVLNTSGHLVTNTGTMRASNTGGLLIQNTAVVNTGGTVAATTAGSHVDLSGSHIQGGKLATANGGVIQTVSGNGVLDGITAGVLTNDGTVLVNDLTILSLLGTIANTGTIQSNQVSTNGSTQIRIASQAVTLLGGGRLVMSNHINNQIYGNSATNTLVNVDNTISGAGQLGAGQMTLVNQAAGVIHADQDPTFFQAGRLVVNTSGNVVINAGTMKATGAGGLLIENTAVENSGLILAAGPMGHVDLSGAAIQGGTLATAEGGVIQTTGHSALDGITAGAVNNTGTLLVNDLTRLDLNGTINNTGLIRSDQQSAGGSTQLRLVGQTVTLLGGGRVALSDNINNLVFGAGGGNELVNVNNTISGAGQIGTGASMFLNNQAAGVIDADQATALILNTGNRLVRNAGLLKASGTGGLSIQSTAVNNAGGTIQASGLGAHVDLVSAHIEGGLLTVAGGGSIQAADRGSTLDGITSGMLTNQGLIRVNNGQLLNLVGTINNTTTIALAGVGNTGNTDLRIAGQVASLQGGGTLAMSNNANNRIYGTNANFQLVNVDNTIAGAGQIGVGASMLLVNKTGGTIRANQKAALVVNLDGNVIENAGTMESTGTAAFNGGLVLDNTTINNAGGTIRAVGAQAHVNLSSAGIQGGTLTTSLGGVIQTTPNTSSTLDGITAGTLSNKGNLLITDTSTLGLVGTIANTGTILQGAISANSNTDVRVVGPVATMTGTGQWIMSDNPNNRVFGNSGVFQLINQGNTISGAGQFGAGQMEYVNAAGSIVATGTNALVINLGSGNGVNNAGASMIGKGKGGMVLASGIFTNNGTMTAGDGSAITFQSNATNTNLAAGDLVGGTWRAIASGHGATLSMTGGPIVANAATIVLQGAGSVIQAGSGAGGTPYTILEQSLTTIANGGQLQVLGARGYASALSLDVAGTVQLQGGTFDTNALALAGGGTLVGTGTVQDTIANAGLVNAKGGTLLITENVTGSGKLQADAGSTLALEGGTNTVSTVTNNGIISLGNSDRLNVTGPVDPTSTGIFLLNDSSVLNIGVDKGSSHGMSFIGAGRLEIAAVGSFGTNVGLATYQGPRMFQFGAGDAINLKDFNFAGAVIDSYTSATGLLQMHSGATKASLMFENASLGAGSFQLLNDGDGHVLLMRG